MADKPRSTKKCPIPDELPDAPRSVCRRPSRMRWGSIIATFFFLGMIGIADGVNCYHVIRDIMVSKYGTTVLGQIVKRSTYTSTSTRKGRTATTTHYRITFSYPVNEQNRTSSTDVDSSAYFRLKEGDQVQVRILSAWDTALVIIPEPGLSSSLADFSSPHR